METASIAHIKKELQSQTPEQLLALCIHLAKYKKENKEVLDYLLFKSHDEEMFKSMVKEEVVFLFEEINVNSIFFVKKSIRKILRLVNKYCKYASHSTTTIELLLFYCQQLKNMEINYKSNLAILSIYENQVKKIKKEILKLHEDLQFDYEQELLGL